MFLQCLKISSSRRRVEFLYDCLYFKTLRFRPTGILESLGTDNGDGAKQNHLSVLYTSQRIHYIDFKCLLKYQSFSHQNANWTIIYGRLCLRVKMLLLLRTSSLTLPLCFPNSLLQGNTTATSVKTCSSTIAFLLEDNDDPKLYSLEYSSTLYCSVQTATLCTSFLRLIYTQTVKIF